MKKVGRNDPCPCGSGKKYKNCCMNSNVIPFNRDTEDYDDFNSGEEMEAAHNAEAELIINEPLEDFFGLSPVLMTQIIDSSISDNKNICELNFNLKERDVADAPVLERVRIFLKVFLENASPSGSIPLTGKGNVKVVFCKKYYELSTGRDFSSSFIRNEDNYIDLQITRFLLEERGYIYIEGSRMFLTEKGRKFVDKPDNVKAYGEFLSCYMEDFAWEYFNIHLEDIFYTIIQDSVLFSLYLVKKVHKEKPDYDELSLLFIRALFWDIYDSENEIMIMYVSTIYKHLFLEHFCTYFGLLEGEYLPEILKKTDSENRLYVRVTPLFNKLFNWKI